MRVARNTLVPTPPKSNSPWLAPIVVVAHIAEEASSGFLDWFNQRVEPDLTMSGFVAINATGLLVTVLLAVPAVRSRHYLLGVGLIAWLSFLMPANGILHLTASLLYREYVPGTVTAGILYFPYFVAATVAICRNFTIGPITAILAATVGAVPMAVQGISVLTVGRRLLW